MYEAFNRNLSETLELLEAGAELHGKMVGTDDELTDPVQNAFFDFMANPNADTRDHLFRLVNPISSRYPEEAHKLLRIAVNYPRGRTSIGTIDSEPIYDLDIQQTILSGARLMIDWRAETLQGWTMTGRTSIDVTELGATSAAMDWNEACRNEVLMRKLDRWGGQTEGDPDCECDLCAGRINGCPRYGREPEGPAGWTTQKPTEPGLYWLSEQVVEVFGGVDSRVRPNEPPPEGATWTRPVPVEVYETTPDRSGERRFEVVYLGSGRGDKMHTLTSDARCAWAPIDEPAAPGVQS